MTPAPALRPARAADLPGVLDLLAAATLPVDGVAEGFAEGYAVAEAEGKLVAVIGIEPYGRVGLLRSAAVLPDYRGQGLGAELVRDRLAWARTRRLEALFLLTTTAEDYFPRFGFEPVTREALPPALSASAELRGACPDSARAFRLWLDPPRPTNAEEPPEAAPRV